MLVLDSEAVQNFGTAAFNFYLKAKKFFTKVEGSAGLSAYINGLNYQPASPMQPPPAPLDILVTLTKTLTLVETSAGDSTKDILGRTFFASKFINVHSSELFVARVTGAIHYTMGGIAINILGQVCYVILI